MADDIAERLAAVERAVTGEDADLPSLADDAERTRRLDELEREVAEIRERIEELDAALQAVRGYVGSVQSVNEDVEARANAAVAGVEALEARVDDLEADGKPSECSTELDAEPPEASAHDPDPFDTATEPGTPDPDERPADAAGGRDGTESSDGGVVDRLRDAL